ncbi:MAG: chemotaxis protein CheW [Bdellovibrionota bacterium]
MAEEKVEQIKNPGKFEEGKRYLEFSLGEEKFAIPLLAVKEVIAIPQLTPVPYSPKHFLGIMNLRGQIISVIDLRQKFDIKPNDSKENAVIICDLSSIVLGVVVDSVNSVLSPKAADISDVPRFDSKQNNDYIEAIYRQKESLVLFLDIAKVLSAQDHKAISKALNSIPEAKVA